MMRWMRILLVVGYWSLLGWLPADASDHLHAKSMNPDGVSMPVRSARACSSEDLLGSWDLVKYDSSYRFKNQRAPYLFPHQVFQYSLQGSAKSLHSLRPILGQSDALFSTVPVGLLYQVKKDGRVSLITRGHVNSVETWACEVVTQGRPMNEQAGAEGRGNLIMTLIGSEGQPLFVRHLRKRAA
jgi:hypothetical protein